MHTVLVVEDDHDLRVTLRDVLQDRGYTVHTAATGLDGLEALRELKPCVILLDQNMPLMDGATFLTTAKTSIPVIVVSAADDRTQGATAYFAKPFKVDLLLDKIDELCSVHA